MAEMERMSTRWILFSLLLSVMISGSQSAVMSIDLGNEWIKVAIVSPGKPMEIALNTDSSRKTPFIVAFRNGERHFGEAALTTATRFPEKSYTHLLDVIGKRMDNPLVQKYMERFPYLNLTKDPVKETVIFHHPEGMSFTAEELVGMVIEKCRSFAETAVGDGSRVTEAVITVPPFMTQCERRSILTAAYLAGVKVLQLMNSNTGVALNYGVFRMKDFNESSPSHILFYDMGSTGTTATLVSYQVMKRKEQGYGEKKKEQGYGEKKKEQGYGEKKKDHGYDGYGEKIPTLTVLGVGYDRTLGGLEMQLRLRSHLARRFSEQHGVGIERVTSNHRAMSKLLKEAGRVKRILSANTETVGQVENVMDDLDLRVEVSRSEFESLSSDLLGERIKRPVQDALAMSGLSLSHLDHVILFGGNSRVPRVQEVLQDAVQGRDLGKSINSDEASALGSVYQAAYLSKGFKVKQFTVKDINLFPIQVEFNRNLDSDELENSGGKEGSGKEGSGRVKSMTRTIFGRGNVFPQKKVLTFSKHTSDFDFFVNYGDVRKILSVEEVAHIGSINITRSRVEGVKGVFEKHLRNDMDGMKRKESKGIKAHFRLDESCLLSLDSVEATFEQTVEEESTTDSNVVSDTIANLGKTFSQFFGSKNVDQEGSVETAPDSGADNETDPSGAGNGTAGSDSKSADPSSADSSSAQTGSKTAENGTVSNSTVVPKKEVKIKSIKEPLQVVSDTVDVVSSDAGELSESMRKLKELRKKDEEKLKHDSIRNNLESFIAETRMKLYEDEYEVATSESEREMLMQQLNQASEWLEEESDLAGTEDLQSRLSSLKTETSGMFDRVREHRERPEAVKALNDMLNISSIFLSNARNLSLDQQIFTDVEINALHLLVTETEEWIHDTTTQQSKTPLSSPPVVTIKQIAEKISNLDREVKYLVNKLKITPPKKKVVEKVVGKEEEEKEETSERKKEEDEKSGNDVGDGDGDSSGEDDSKEEGVTNEITNEITNEDVNGDQIKIVTNEGDEEEHSKKSKERIETKKQKKRRRRKDREEEEAHSEL